MHIHSLQHDLSTDSDLYLLLSSMAIWFQSGINFWYSFLCIWDKYWSHCGLMDHVPWYLFILYKTLLSIQFPLSICFSEQDSAATKAFWPKETWVNILKYILYIRVLSLWKWMQNLGVFWIKTQINKHGGVFSTVKNKMKKCQFSLKAEVEL